MDTAAPVRGIRLVILGSHALMRSALRCLLDQQQEFSVVADAELIEDEEDMACDVFLVDVGDGEAGALGLVKKVADRYPSSRVLALANAHDSELHARAIQLGAVGVVLSDETPDTLFKAIHKINAGEMWLSRGRAADVLRRVRRELVTQARDSQQIASLTRREREIIALICRGMKNAAIAEQLFISQATVRNHLTSILDKLQLSNRFELVVFAFHNGLADCDPVNSTESIPRP